MVQAAVEGIVDFGRAEFYSPQWHRHLQLILSGLERRNHRDLRQLTYDQAVAIYTSSKIKAEQLEEIGQKVSDIYYDIRETYYPQEKDRRVQHEKETVRKDIQGWESKFGSLDNEETRDKVAQFAAAMEQLRVDTANKMRSQASSQLGYVGHDMGIDPSAKRNRPRKGRK